MARPNFVVGWFIQVLRIKFSLFQVDYSAIYKLKWYRKCCDWKHLSNIFRRHENTKEHTIHMYQWIPLEKGIKHGKILDQETKGEFLSLRNIDTICLRDY